MTLGWVSLICGLVSIGLAPQVVGEDRRSQIAMSGFGLGLILLSLVLP